MILTLAIMIKKSQDLGFTKKYNVHKLVHFEVFNGIMDAIIREKQIKGWLRSKKITLIESENPKWKDLYKEIV